MGWRVKLKSATPEIFLRDLAGITYSDPFCGGLQCVQSGFTAHFIYSEFYKTLF